MDAKVKWYECSGGTEGDVVVSTRLLLSRNISGFPSVVACALQTGKRRCRQFWRQWKMKIRCWPTFSFIPLWQASQEEMVSYVERRLAAPEFVSRRMEKEFLSLRMSPVLFL